MLSAPDESEVIEVNWTLKVNCHVNPLPCSKTGPNCATSFEWQKVSVGSNSAAIQHILNVVVFLKEARGTTVFWTTAISIAQLSLTGTQRPWAAALPFTHSAGGVPPPLSCGHRLPMRGVQQKRQHPSPIGTCR